MTRNNPSKTIPEARAELEAAAVSYARGTAADDSARCVELLQAARAYAAARSAAPAKRAARAMARRTESCTLCSVCGCWRNPLRFHGAVCARFARARAVRS